MGLSAELEKFFRGFTAEDYNRFASDVEARSIQFLKRSAAQPCR